MVQLKSIICIAVCLLGITGYTYGADKYTDENRPYEFGFTIEGEQHRHEKKGMELLKLQLKIPNILSVLHYTNDLEFR